MSTGYTRKEGADGAANYLDKRVKESGKRTDELCGFFSFFGLSQIFYHVMAK
jgi:hypothetical protein